MAITLSFGCGFWSFFAASFFSASLLAGSGSAGAWPVMRAASV